MDGMTPGMVEDGPIVVAVRRASVPGAVGAGTPLGAALDAALAAAGLSGVVATAKGAASAEASADAAPPTPHTAPAPPSKAQPPPRTATVLVGLGAVVFTAPALLARLVTRLDEAGLAVRVLGAVPERDRDLGWTPRAVAARHHYPPIEIVDPLAELSTSGFGEESLRHGRPVARAWLEADLRIVLAPCATDAAQGFVGVLAALGGVAPLVPGADPAEAVADLLRQAPPHLAVLDATLVSHGPVGTAVRREMRAGTLVAARSALLVDVAAATLLGLDPGTSPAVAACLAEVGLPARHRVDGDLAPLPGVVTPSLPLVRSLPATGGAAGLARVLAAAAAVDAGVPGGARGSRASPGGPGASNSPALVVAAGPGDADPVLDALRSALGPWVVAAADSPAAATALAGIQGAAALAANAVNAWRTTFAKDTLARVEAPLGLDLSAYRAADYEAVEELLRPLVDQVAALPDTGDPLKWQHLDGSVLFEVTRTVNADYRSWVARVDLSHAIRLMADYLGGRCVVVARDRSGRPVRQAERNLYLPQPNYVAFTGGRVIDVCKLEVLRYHRESQEIWWRTVRSPNGSADYDDGTVEFADVGPGRTRITVRGRQRFTLPLFWQVVDIDRTPGLREVLTTDAYHRFFTTTLDNFEACYEGRPFQIGRPPVDSGLPTRDLGLFLATAREAAGEWLARSAQGSGAPGSSGSAAGAGWSAGTGASGAPRSGPAGLLSDIVGQWAGAAGWGAAPGSSRTFPPDEIDSDGFRHFRAEGRD